MEYLFSCLLLALNLLDYEVNIPHIAFFPIGLALFSALFYTVYLKCKDFKTTCITLLCFTWPFSWINIFGDATETLQLPWFYILGAMLLVNAIFEYEKISNRRVNSVVLGLFVTVMILMVYPLFLSPSFSRGMSEFVMIGFFLVMGFFAFLNSNTMSEENRNVIVNAYIWTVAISCLLIIFQFVYYNAFGEGIFKFSVGNYHGAKMVVSKLLMEDSSSATIMLGCGVFYMLERFNNKERRFLYLCLIGITVIGIALTTRRTSIVSLVICLAIYILFRYKKASKRILMVIVFVGIVSVMLYYLMVTRPADSYSVYLEDNGRIPTYLNSLKLSLENPFGIGFDNEHLALLCGGTIPHNTILRWLNMCGIVFTVLMCAILVYIISCAWKKRLKDEFWVLVYCFIALNFIPDIINARFFIIPCMLAMLCCPRDKSCEVVV